MTDEDRQKFDFDIQAVHWPSYLKVYAQVNQFLPIVSTLRVIVSFRVSETSYSKRTLPPRPRVEGVFKLQKNFNTHFLTICVLPSLESEHLQHLQKTSNPQETDLPLVFGLADQRGLRSPHHVDNRQVLPLIRVFNKCY